MGGVDVGVGVFYDVVFYKCEILMGKFGFLVLIKNFRVFCIVLFVCIGGVLYGYN